MPRPKLTYEDRCEKAHENFLNNMMFLYTAASHDDEEQYKRLKVGMSFLKVLMERLDEKFEKKK